MKRFNVCVVGSKDVECDCRLDLISSAEGDFVMHEEVRKMVQSHHLDLATYAKSLDAAQAEAEAAKRCLHVEMSMRKASEVEPPKSVGPWHVVPGHDGAFVPVTKDGRSWWNGYFQASIAIDVATLLNEREAHNAEIESLRSALRLEIEACDMWRKERGLNAKSSNYQGDSLAVAHDSRRALAKENP